MRTSCFLVVDRTLAVSAVSARAEQLLGISEQHAVGSRASGWLTPIEFGASLDAMLHAAISSDATTPAHTSCSIACEPPAVLDVLIAPCGPPPGVLLMLG
ncbi:MAG TPA: hypothetical protein VLJ42_11830 [Solirubrobacteraceae bacterium]|nr:hypothetical protein [Solirubrobacteraceae bacterium]